MSTWLNDLKNNAAFANDGSSLVPAVRTATANGAAVDLVSSDGPCFALMEYGAVSGTSPASDVKVQESDTSGGTFTDIPGAVFPQVAAANKFQIINFKRTKRFCRLVIVIAGTTPSFASAGQIFGQKKAI